MADIVTLNDRWNALHDKIERLVHQRDALDVVATTPRELRQVRRLSLRIDMLDVDAEEMREVMDAEYARLRS